MRPYFPTNSMCNKMVKKLTIIFLDIFISFCGEMLFPKIWNVYVPIRIDPRVIMKEQIPGVSSHSATQYEKYYSLFTSFIDML